MHDINFMVKYCGGCNSSYDRVKTVRKIQEKISLTINLYDNKTVPDILLIVKGCKSECIIKDEYKSKYGIFLLQEEKDLQPLLDEIIYMIRNITF